MEEKRILIISHNPINTTDNMGKTLGNIFSGFDEKELCQLYFREQNVEAKNCENFFCIDDVSMVKSVINRFYKTGKIVKNNTIIKTTNEAKEEIFQKGRKRTGSIYILRNLLWKIGKWNTKELEGLLKEMKPSAIFFAAGDYTFAFNIAQKISKTKNIPLYIYCTDEFYRKNLGKETIANRIYKNRYRKIFRNSIKNSKTYFTITENMLEFYEKEFGKKGKVLMNSTDIQPMGDIEYRTKKTFNISYIGNLGYDRWKNIIEIKDVIDRVNNETSTKYKFKVYSGEKNKEVLNMIKDKLKDDYCGAISKEEVIRKMKETDILIHTENFENTNKEKVKYSLSTKIPDILASQRLMLAYGPREIASIQYIEKNNVGIIAGSNSELESKLKELVEKKINVEEILKRAKDLVEKQHRIDGIYKMLYETMMGEKNEKNNFTD